MQSSGIELLSVNEVSRIYKLSKDTLYTLIKTDPTFPCLNIGPRKNYRIPADQFKAWLDQRIKERHYFNFKVPTADQLFRIGRN